MNIFLKQLLLLHIYVYLMQEGAPAVLQCFHVSIQVSNVAIVTERKLSRVRFESTFMCKI